MAKKAKTIILKCAEKCPKKCKLEVRDVEGVKLDGRYAIEDYASMCPNRREALFVAWEAVE